jgi:hypothetical protein
MMATDSDVYHGWVHRHLVHGAHTHLFRDNLLVGEVSPVLEDGSHRELVMAVHTRLGALKVELDQKQKPAKVDCHGLEHPLC